MGRHLVSVDRAPLASPLRVVHLVNSLAIGGLEKVVLDLVRYRNRHVFGVRVLCLDQSGVLQQGFSELGVPVETIGTAGSVPARILRLASRLKQIRPDVLHTHNPQAHLHGAIAARLAGVPVVIHTRHGRGYFDRQPAAAFGRLASRWTSLFVAVSDDAARAAQAHEGVPGDKLRVIRNGVDLSRFPHGFAASTGPRHRAITVGRLDPVKDQATLLRASRLVVDRNPAFRLDIVGDGPSRPDLEALARTLDLTRHVTFFGYREQVAPILGGADFFVLSSVSEGLPLALLEAMATGLPIVATDVGGNREVVVTGDNGYLVPARDPEALAQAMGWLLDDPTNLRRMGERARQRVERHFNLRTVVAEYEDMYARCLEHRPASPMPVM